MNTQKSDLPVAEPQPPLPINPNLVWEYEIPPDAEQSEAFRHWYIARVLSRGRAEDIKAIGIDTIYAYFSTLNLPPEIRRFWEWYFDLPEIQHRYEHSNPASAKHSAGDRPQSSKQ